MFNILGQDDLHVVEGFVIDRNKRKLAFLYGKWTEFLCSVDIESLEEFLGAKVEKVDPSASNLPKHAPLALGVIPHSKVLWQVDPRPDNSNLFYNFSQFTMGLNEMTPNYLVKILFPHSFYFIFLQLIYRDSFIVSGQKNDSMFH